jgi:glucokinase
MAPGCLVARHLVFPHGRRYDAGMILAGDVGGTKTRLALYEPGSAPRAPVLDRRYLSADYPSLEAIVREFVSGAAVRPTRAAFGIAGPVVEGRVDTTNLPWRIRSEALTEAIGGGEVRLLNDLESTAWGLSELEPADLRPLVPGTPAGGNRALIAAGTGLGEALVVRNAGAWHPTASEGGHTDFGPRDPLEDELNVWLRAKYGRVSYERILSGPGLADLHRFMGETGRGAEPPAISARFEAADDPAAIVTGTALDGSSERARLTLERFVSIYGAEAGNLALKSLAVGGVFVGGGIAPRIVPFLSTSTFARAFRSKGRLSPVLEPIPVNLILDDRAALWGAAVIALGPFIPEPRRPLHPAG